MIEIDYELSAQITNALRAQRRRRKAGFSPSALFAASEPGAWLDPSDLSTLFQDNAGTTPVTAAGQPVGLVLDKSKGLVLGSELVTNGTFDTNITGWTNLQSGTIAWDASGGIAVTAAADGADANAQTSITTTVGRTYKVTWTVVSSEGGWLFRIRNSNDYNYQSVFATTGTFTAYVVSSAISNTVNLIATDASKKVVFDNISVRELPGAHASQATAASRPTYRVTSGIPNIEDDLVDDAINWTAPAGNYTVAWVDTAGSVTIQTAQALSGATDALKAQNMVGYVAIGRALTAAETASLTAWFKAKAGV